ncbi:MAG: hypothetical protein C4308_11825 [Chitinophagaceae bacterium]
MPAALFFKSIALKTVVKAAIYKKSEEEIPLFGWCLIFNCSIFAGKTSTLIFAGPYPKVSKKQALYSVGQVKISIKNFYFSWQQLQISVGG